MTRKGSKEGLRGNPVGPKRSSGLGAKEGEKIGGLRRET